MKLQAEDMVIRKEKIGNPKTLDELIEEQNIRHAKYNEVFSRNLNGMTKYTDWLVWVSMLLAASEILGSITL